MLMIPVSAAESTPDQTVRIQSSKASPFNDTDGDGLGEFEGWSTSLCWWANRIGNSEALTADAAKKFFSDEGLDLNIGRYNLGGGDSTVSSLDPNEKAILCTLEEGSKPSFGGSKMQISSTTYNSSTLWQKTDRDLGLLKGAKVGTLKEIGWIGPIGGTVGNADMLTYTINAKEAGSYTVKVLVKLDGTHNRGVSLQVNNDKIYSASTDEISRNVMATQGNVKLYMAVLNGVQLNAGENTLQLGGNTSSLNTYMHDYIEMAVIPEASVLEDGTQDPGLHKSHIIRSDSAVPGYCTDITPIVITEEKPLSWYEENFERADASCGYAWNYDWSADEDQLAVLQAAAAASGQYFIAEIFSNSPPYFMTESLCSSGNYTASQNNLRTDSYDAFVTYMADVIEHLSKNDVSFESASAFNEPNTDYWGAYSNKQEGCHFDANAISTILVKLDAKLKEKNIDLKLSASDETSIDTQITTYNALSSDAKSVVDRIDTHTYGGSNRSGLQALAKSEEKNLWMSEVDGGFTAGSNAGEMSAALGLGKRIITDVNGLNCSAWIFWNMIDKHADNSEYGQSWISDSNGIDKASLEDLHWNGQTGGYWGVAAADHNSGSLALSMKYYGFGQFTRYIRPGYTIMASSDSTLCAYDPDEQKAVIVAINDKADEQTVKFSLGDFSHAPTTVTAIRTSGSMEGGEKWADVSDTAVASKDENSITGSLKANSITTYIIEGIGKPKSMLEDSSSLRTDLSFKVGEGKTALQDKSGYGLDAPLSSLTSSASASYNGASIVSFNQNGYVTLPSGMIEDGESFTISMTAYAPQTSSHWLLTLGSKEGEWPNVDNYFFLTPKSGQGGYSGKILAAISQSGENRLPVNNDRIPSSTAFNTYTIVSNGKTITVYLDGEKVTELEHSKDWTKILAGDKDGYIGKSLYTPDPLFSGAVASFRVWNKALNAEELTEALAQEPNKDDCMKAALARVILNKNRSVDAIESDLSFPAQVYGQNVTWSVAENAAISSDGKYTMPLADTKVQVTASFTGTDQSYVLDLNVPGEDPDKIVADAKAELNIPNADNIKGNITLPDHSGKASITWNMSESGNGIIDLNEKDGTVEGYGKVPAGTVTRPAKDTNVTLTATISYKDRTETKVFDLTVKAAPKQQEMTDYFFAYFTGEGKSNGEQIYFSASQDGLNWNDLNDGKPSLESSLGEKGVRDPYILRSPEGDKFYIIATDLKINGNGNWDRAQKAGSQSLLIWESDDLIDWGEPRLVEVSASIDAGCTWAPEATYDDLTGEYIVYWSSKVKGDDYGKQRVYYSRTRDFYTFSEPQVWIDKDQSSIDTTVIKHNGTYYRLTKNEGGQTNSLGAKTKTLFLEKSNTLLGNYTHIPSDSLNANQYVEGPAIYKLNGDDSESDKWILLADDFGGIGYYPLEATDLESGSFTKLESGFKMPSGARHGTPIAISAEEYDRIMLNAAKAEPVNTWYSTAAGNGLPESVAIGHSTYPVTWNTNNIWNNHKAFDTVTITGTAITNAEKQTELEVSAAVQLIPENMEYMIDAHNPDSQSHKNAMASSSLMKNTVSEQAKTDNNTWGSISIIGEDSGNTDMVAFSQTSTTNPYTGGYWARGGKTISYAMTLPKGDHTIYVGVNGWWSVSRTMKLEVTTSKGTSKLFDCNVTKNQETLHSGNIHLDKEETITLTISKTDNQDPIISWIGASLKTSPDKTQLETLIGTAAALTETDYTPASWTALQNALSAAQTVYADPNAAEAAVQSAITALNDAKDALKRQWMVTFKNGETTLKSAYVEDGKSAETLAPAEAEITIPEGKLFKGWDKAFEAVHAATIYQTVFEDAPVPVDKSALQTKYDAIIKEDLKVRPDTNHAYTTASFNALQSALSDAAKILADEEADQETVYNAKTKLDEAYVSLSLIDLTYCNLTLAKATALNLADFKDASASGLAAAKEAVSAQIANPVSQADVNSAAADLNRALLALRKDPAKNPARPELN